MKKIHIVVITFLLFFPLIMTAQTAERYLAELDSLLGRTHVFLGKKESVISELKQRLAKASTSDDRYMLCSMLYDEYSRYNVDSAMNYVGRCLGYAARTKNREWSDCNHIRRSFLLSASGLLKEAEEEMKRVSPSPMLSRELKSEYFGQMIYLYSHLGNFSVGGENDLAAHYYAMENNYKDSVMTLLDPSDPEYLWFRGWKSLGVDSLSNGAVMEPLSRLLSHAKFDNPSDAKNAYMMARLCQDEKRDDDYLRYMALSAIADLRSSNRDIASLEELARTLFDRGDIDRAYRYVNYCYNAAMLYPNRVRMVGLAQMHDNISKSYLERLSLQERRIRLYLILVCALAVILVGAVTLIYVQKKRLSASRNKLDEANRSLNLHIKELSEAHAGLDAANDKLKELNTKLKTINEELREANVVKEEYLGYVFTLSSSYIGKLDELRKTVSRKLKAGQYDGIRKMTDSPSLAKAELKEFYHSFDTVFLHIFPEFVENFNSLLEPSERIIPKDGELLNTRLRIYALVRLGIGDSVKIAEFLHCSPQTIYNNRFKVRSTAIVPRDNFPEAVRRLGKVADV